MLKYVVIIAMSTLAGFALSQSITRTPALEAPVAMQPLSRAPAEPKLLNPTVVANVEKHYIINFQPLREQLESIQRRYQNHTYVYFVYLGNAAWVGLNERELFVAASTVKVPLAMAIYKMIESSKLSEDTEYTLEDLDLNAQFGDLYATSTRQTFTVGELVGIMLEKSDNTAANALFTVAKRAGTESPLDDVYTQMGWEFTVGEVPTYKEIHLKLLSNMFLSLYNATYVNEEHSERILQHLAHTPFDEKIVAGIPAGTTAAHKIGSYADSDTYSDCGIVYVPQRNYILCTASREAPESVANEFMATISRAVYGYVTTH